MSEYQELIKNFDKSRNYMRDFYIYGFKARGEYTYKSKRTYDNERRRVESWLGEYIRWDYSSKGKSVCICMDSASVPVNPLYRAWKSKSFTDNDIQLHFYILDTLSELPGQTAEQMTDLFCTRYDRVFDVQTVRLKLREYALEGVLQTRKEKRALLYTLAKPAWDMVSCQKGLYFALSYFQGAAPFGFIGSTLLDAWGKENAFFRFPHSFAVHTLEDKVLYALLESMEKGESVECVNLSRRSGGESVVSGVPMKILASVTGGRRYLALYQPESRRLSCQRLDSIQSVRPTKQMAQPLPKERFEHAIKGLWGVSFGNRNREEEVFVTFRIDEEKEAFIIGRLQREGRGGEVLRIEKNRFLYTRKVHDANEMLSWLRSFTGRIEAFECTNPYIRDKFLGDADEMYRMYFEEEGNGAVF